MSAWLSPTELPSPTGLSADYYSPQRDSGDFGGIIAIILVVIGVVGVIFIGIHQCYKYLGLKVTIAYNDRPIVFHTVSNVEIRVTRVEDFLNNIAKEKPIRFSPEQVNNYTNGYGKMLGSGGFGAVYKGELSNGVPIAVKVLRENLETRVLEDQFMSEVGTIGRTYHINLVRLYGFCFDGKMRALIYEYLENGSLDKYLFKKDHIIDWGLLYEIAIGTAKGIRYLHEECQHRIIHYDIKPANILLDAQFNPKVADFGLAKLLNRDRSHVSMTGGRGTPGYAAPEMWMPYPVTYKCDVYSFGMLLFEIVGQRRNLDLTLTESQEWYPLVVYEKFANGKLSQIVSSCEIEEVHREKAERMCMVALWCVQYNPEARPPMSMVVKMLEGEMEIKPPTNPFEHMAPYFTAYNDMWSEGSTDKGSSGATGTDSGSSESDHETEKQDVALVRKDTTIMRKYEIEIATS